MKTKGFQTFLQGNPVAELQGISAIQILLAIENSDDSKEIRRLYQRHKLGRLNSNHCLLELMPMASRSTSLWLWKDIFQDYYGLDDRLTYFLENVPKRIARLKELISKYSPKLIVFYSTQPDYIEKWNEISGINSWEWKNFNKRMKYGWQKVGNTLFVITPHPTYTGLTKSDFPIVGEFVRNELNNKNLYQKSSIESPCC